MQSEARAGSRQDSSCPLVQKSRRDESGLASMRVYLRTGRRLSLPVFVCGFVFPFFTIFFFYWEGEELCPVFQSTKMGMETSELRHLTNCELRIIHCAKNELV